MSNSYSAMYNHHKLLFVLENSPTSSHFCCQKLFIPWELWTHKFGHPKDNFMGQVILFNPEKVKFESWIEQLGLKACYQSCLQCSHVHFQSSYGLGSTCETIEAKNPFVWPNLGNCFGLFFPRHMLPIFYLNLLSKSSKLSLVVKEIRNLNSDIILNFDKRF